MRATSERLDDDVLTVVTRDHFLSEFKKAGPEGDPAPVLGRYDASKNELQTELNSAASARADDGIGSRNIRRGTGAAKWLNGRVVETETALSAIRVGEIRMIKDVEKLRPELRAHALRKVPILSHRKINVFEAEIGEGVAAHVAELPEGRRKHDRIAFLIAAEVGQ